MIENEFFQTLFNIIPFGIYVVDVETLEIIYMNTSMIQKRGDYIGKKCYESIYGEDKPCYFCKNQKLLNNECKPNGETVIFELFNHADDNWYQLQEKTISWPDGRVAKYSIGVNITELKETQNRLAEAHAKLAISNAELENLSRTDRLTQTSNRLKIDEIMQSEVYKITRYNRLLSVIIIDIDHFKLVNDNYGHQVGDNVLKQLAKVLLTNVRAADCVGRWGGEEFVIICPETDLEGARVLAENLRKKIEEYEFKIANHITASFGVASFRTGDNEEAMLKRADSALYMAKINGRNRIESDNNV